jgi:tripartite-type tricarboxylate transporter receptor subunit TctC
MSDQIADRGESLMKTILRMAVLCVALALAGTVSAQQYPSKPVRILIPFPPGGVTDNAGRLIAQKLSERLGQQFYIENQPGAGGNLGMSTVARSAGDGYTILLASSSIVVNPSLYTKIPYDIDKDFIPVTKAGGTPNSWVVNADFPAKTMKELIDMIKREPGKYSVASPGTGTTPSLSIEMMRLGLGLNFVTVPFQGGGPMTQSLLGGHTPIACSALGNYVNLIKEGKLRALAVAARKRSAALPDIPTLDELGIKDQEAETMTGVFVPAGTPKEIVELLQREFSAVVNTPEVKARLLALGVEAEGDSSADFAKYVKSEVAKWKKVITDAKINQI